MFANLHLVSVSQTELDYSSAAAPGLTKLVTELSAMPDREAA
jgi:hypothetical protein